MAESFTPMWLKSKSKSKTKPEPGSTASRRSAPTQVEERDGRIAPFSSFAMSSGRLFLDRVARQHCPSPLHRHTQINMTFSKTRAEGDISTLPGRGHFSPENSELHGCPGTRPRLRRLRCGLN